VDVALRAVRRNPNLRPGLVEHRLGLPPGLARVVLADLVNLMPGTLTVDLDEDRLTIHVLDTAMPVREQILELEGRIAAVTGPSTS
jgi:multicomponent Na+:H+ antiporter subunit E